MSDLAELQRLLDTSPQKNAEVPDQSNNASSVAQLDAMLQLVHNQQRVEQVQQEARQQQPQVHTDSLLSSLGQLNQLLASQETARGQQATQSQQQVPVTAAATSHQQMHALVQQQMHMLEAQQQPAMMSADHAHAQQQVSSSVPFHFTSTLSTAKQQQQDQSTQDEAGTAARQSAEPPKRRRGRPASNSTKMHPNLVYVRRFRERQKQMVRYAAGLLACVLHSCLLESQVSPVQLWPWLESLQLSLTCAKPLCAFVIAHLAVRLLQHIDLRLLPSVCMHFCMYMSAERAWQSTLCYRNNSSNLVCWLTLSTCRRMILRPL